MCDGAIYMLGNREAVTMELKGSTVSGDRDSVEGPSKITPKRVANSPCSEWYDLLKLK